MTASSRGSEGVECLLGLGMGLGRRFAYATNATPELGNMHPSSLGNGNGVMDDSGSGAPVSQCAREMELERQDAWPS
jgi:hypothetical protein